MYRRWAVVLAVSLAIGACEQQPQAPLGPDFATTAKPTTGPCDFGVIKSLITTYFASQDQTLTQGLKDEMQTASLASNTAVTRERGFDILREVARVTNLNTRQGTAADGAKLTNAVLLCMELGYTTSTVPPVDSLAKALTPTTGGAYYVRGGLGDGATHAADATSELVAATGTAGSASGWMRLSVLAPASGFTWRNTAVAPDPRNGILDERVLVYGYKVTDGQEWAVIRSDATFNPYAVVTLCNAGDDETLMIEESNVGVLAFNAEEANCDLTTKNLSVRRSGSGAFALLDRLTHFAITMIRPSTLSATALATAKSGTGTVTGAKSKFVHRLVPTGALDWSVKPAATIRLLKPTVIEVRVTTDNSATGVNGTCVTFQGFNNNGQKTSLSGPGSTKATCNADFPNDPSILTTFKTIGTESKAGYAQVIIVPTKAGTLTITGTAGQTIQLRAGVITGTPTVKVNVKP
jgi:hypothetical protein